MVFQELLKQQGYFEEFGVAPTTLNVADGSKLMGALFSGSSDICILSGFSQVFPAVEKGGKLKIVAGAGLLLQDAIYSAKPDIQHVKDLEGKTVGTGSPGALLHQFTVALLRKKGVDVSKVKFVNVGSSASVFNAVVAGTVDAGPSLIDVYAEQKKYGVHSLVDGDLWKELAGIYLSRLLFCRSRHRRKARGAGSRARGLRQALSLRFGAQFARRFHARAGGRFQEIRMRAMANSNGNSPRSISPTPPI